MLFKTTRGLGLFIHVPKTGGNTIQQCLLEHGLSLDQPVCTGHQDGRQRFELRGPITESKHQSLQRYHSLSPSTAALPVVLCVRRPFERLVSLYFSPHRWLRRCPRSQVYRMPQVARFDEAAFSQMIVDSPAAVDYLAAAKPSSTPGLAAEHHIIMQHLTTESRLAVLKTENLSVDFAAYFGFPLATEPRNVSPYREQAAMVLASQALRAQVEERSHHRADLDLFYT